MLFDPKLLHAEIDGWFTFLEALNVNVVVYLRQNAPNFGIFYSHGYTPTTVTSSAVEFSLSMPS